MEGSKLSSTILAIFLLSVIGISSGDQATSIFVFGDSYADTGNFYPTNRGIASPWKYPYGITWPRYPCGRVSSGRLQTDYLAEILGLPSPMPYRMLNDSNYNKIAGKGINFAVSGSGVFKSFGLPELSIQVDNFKEALRSQKYDADHLRRSVVLLSVNGNDYTAKNVNLIFNGTREFVGEVIREMKLQLRELYNLGLRTFLISNTLPFDCQPGLLEYSGAVCLNTTMDLVNTHNMYLSEAVSELRKLQEANFLILDLFKAFTQVLSEPSPYGIRELRRSCCSSPELNLSSSLVGCGDYDGEGRALFRLCNNPEKFLFFDWYHLTQKGWEAVMGLHYFQMGFVQDGTSTPKSLAQWLYQTLGFTSFAPNCSIKLGM